MASSSAGFTLLEVLIALVVLLTTMAGVASLATVAMHAGSLARQKTVAALLGMREVESIRAGLIGAAGVEYFDANGRSLGSSAAGAVFVARWQASPSPADAATILIRVRTSPIGGDAPLAAVAARGAPNVAWLVASSRIAP